MPDWSQPMPEMAGSRARTFLPNMRLLWETVSAHSSATVHFSFPFSLHMHYTYITIGRLFCLLPLSSPLYPKWALPPVNLGHAEFLLGDYFLEDLDGHKSPWSSG